MTKTPPCFVIVDEGLHHVRVKTSQLIVWLRCKQSPPSPLHLQEVLILIKLALGCGSHSIPQSTQNVLLSSVFVSLTLKSVTDFDLVKFHGTLKIKKSDIKIKN